MAFVHLTLRYMFCLDRDCEIECYLSNESTNTTMFYFDSVAFVFLLNYM